MKQVKICLVFTSAVERKGSVGFFQNLLSMLIFPVRLPQPRKQEIKNDLTLFSRTVSFLRYFLLSSGFNRRSYIRSRYAVTPIITDRQTAWEHSSTDLTPCMILSNDVWLSTNAKLSCRSWSWQWCWTAPNRAARHIADSITVHIITPHTSTPDNLVKTPVRVGPR